MILTFNDNIKEKFIEVSETNFVIMGSCDYSDKFDLVLFACLVPQGYVFCLGLHPKPKDGLQTLPKHWDQKKCKPAFHKTDFQPIPHLRYLVDSGMEAILALQLSWNMVAFIFDRSVAGTGKNSVLDFYNLLLEYIIGMEMSNQQYGFDFSMTFAYQPNPLETTVSLRGELVKTEDGNKIDYQISFKYKLGELEVETDKKEFYLSGVHELDALEIYSRWTCHNPLVGAGSQINVSR